VGTLPRVTVPAARLPAGAGRAVDKELVLRNSVDGIRVMLLHEAEARASGSLLMVTSAVAREGKTTLACHLALSLARSGRKTLLVDCDFRRPRLDKVFDLPPEGGLSDIFSNGGAVPSQVIRACPVPGLSILPAGKVSHRIDQGQFMEGVKGLLDQLRGQYDFIVVDSCPVLPVADALWLGRWMDAVLLSVRPEMSQVPQVYQACERLAALNIPVLGAVVNGVRMTRRNYYEYEYASEPDA
jgi:capsular exopolysaccharide synthesis family protein